MKFKKIIALLLIVFLFTSCSNSQVSNQPTDNNSVPDKTASASNIRVLYSSKDSFDPYTCITSQNRILSQLMLEPLLVLDNNFNINYRLASTVKVKNKTCQIKLSNCKFSDGSFVKPSDIVFSFNKAKDSARFSSSLKHTTSITVTDNDVITITLDRIDENFANLLTFPILKEGTDTLKDIDNQSLPPIGAGKYVFNSEKKQLLPNKYYYGKASSVETITMIDCPDNESVDQAVNTDMVDIFYSDLTDNEIPKMNGNSIDLNQTNIVFLGVNPNNPSLKSSYLRQAISSAINRQKICDSAFFSKATVANGPLPSVLEEIGSFMSILPTSNLEIFDNNMKLAGYTKKDKSGFYLRKNNSPLSIVLLTNSDNLNRLSAAKFIAENLNSAGIKTTVKSLKTKQYKNAIETGSYDLYIGEVKLENNFDLGGLVSFNSGNIFLKNASMPKSDKSNTDNSTDKSNKNSSSDTASKQSNTDITLSSVSAYYGYYSGKYTLQDLLTAYIAELPTIPICFKSALVIYSNNISNAIEPSTIDIFSGM